MFVVEFSCEDILELCVEHCGAKCFVSQNSLVCLLFYALLVIVIKNMGFAVCIFVYMSLSLSRACGLSRRKNITVSSFVVLFCYSFSLSFSLCCKYKFNSRNLYLPSALLVKTSSQNLHLNFLFFLFPWLLFFNDNSTFPIIASWTSSNSQETDEVIRYIDWFSILISFEYITYK